VCRKPAPRKSSSSRILPHSLENVKGISARGRSAAATVAGASDAAGAGS
jgi:hypothetical protein